MQTYWEIEADTQREMARYWKRESATDVPHGSVLFCPRTTNGLPAQLAQLFLWVIWLCEIHSTHRSSDRPLTRFIHSPTHQLTHPITQSLSSRLSAGQIHPFFAHFSTCQLTYSTSHFSPNNSFISSTIHKIWCRIDPPTQSLTIPYHVTKGGNDAPAEPAVVGAVEVDVATGGPPFSIPIITWYAYIISGLPYRPNRRVTSGSLVTYVWRRSHVAGHHVSA